MKKLLIFALAAFAFAACGDKKDNPTPGNLELAGGGTTQEQVFYADEAEETGGFKFYAPAPWTSSVHYSTSTRFNFETGHRAEANGWLRLMMNGQQVNSGGKGTHTLQIEMDENDTETTRSATITIDSNGSKITITVTQDARTVDEAIADGDYEPRPEIPSDPVTPGTMRYVSSMTAFSHFTGEEDELTTLDFVYDNQNRLVELKERGQGQNMLTFTYTPGNVKLYMRDSDLDMTEVWVEEYNCVLNSDGSVASGVLDESYSSSDRNETYRYNLAFNYNNGYISGRTSTGDDGSGAAEYTWTGGNLTKVEFTFTGEDYLSNDIITIEYGNVANNPLCNINVNGFVEDLYPQPFAAVNKLFGKSSEKLVSKVIYTDADGDYYDEYYYAYEFDAQGFVTKITETYLDMPGDMTEYTISYK